MLLAIDTTQRNLHLGLYHPEKLPTKPEAPLLGNEIHSEETYFPHQLVVTRYATGKNRYHSGIIIPAIKQLLEAYTIELEALTGILVNIGPGSFTGVRTGLVTVRTMAQFFPVKVFGFSTFHLLAYHFMNLKSSIITKEKPSAETTLYVTASRGKAYHSVVVLEKDQVFFKVSPDVIDLNQGIHLEQLKTMPLNALLLVDDELAPFFPGFSSSQQTPPSTSAVPFFFNAKTISTVPAMIALMKHYPKLFETSWENLHPFYCQSPSITISDKGKKQL